MLRSSSFFVLVLGAVLFSVPVDAQPDSQRHSSSFKIKSATHNLTGSLDVCAGGGGGGASDSAGAAANGVGIGGGSTVGNASGGRAANAGSSSLGTVDGSGDHSIVVLFIKLRLPVRFRLLSLPARLPILGGLRGLPCLRRMTLWDVHGRNGSARRVPATLPLA
jgi:hypothetical protein